MYLRLCSSGKCGDWDAHNDYHTYGTHGSRYGDGEEYRAYIETVWNSYNLSLSAGNTTTYEFVVNGTYYPWLQGDDWYAQAVFAPIAYALTHLFPTLPRAQEVS